MGGGKDKVIPLVFIVAGDLGAGRLIGVGSMIVSADRCWLSVRRLIIWQEGRGNS